MWNLREIELQFEPDLIEGTVLSSSWLREQSEAKSLLARTFAQCEEAKKQTHEEIELMKTQARLHHEERMKTLLADVEKAFLEKAESVFFEWSQEKSMDGADLVKRAQALCNALFIEMFNRIPDEEKVEAVLNQIIKASDKQVSATLFYHPQHEDQLQAWKETQPHLPWELFADDTQQIDTLLLKTEQGELSLSWPGFRDHILQRLNL